MMKYFYAIVFVWLISSVETTYAQNIAVTGKVIDGGSGTKETLPAVSILLVSSKLVIGQTDIDGNYRVTVAPNAQLEFRYIGFKHTTVSVNNRRTINVTLEPSPNELRTVEVKSSAGYITKTKALTTGSSVKISAKEIQGAPTGDVISLLQGKVAGLNIQNNTGAPGFRGNVSVRGLSNINTSGSGNSAFLTPTSPLYVIDGVPVDDNATFSYGFQQAGPGVSPASQIPAEDIEDIEVLKDAAATALYGSRGAYGVILITTKRGNSKVPVVRYNGSTFLSTVPQLRSVIGGKDERMIRISQILQNDTSYLHAINMVNGIDFLSDSLNAYYNNSTNWQSYFYKPTYNQNHNLSISGGDVAFNYKVALGLYDEKGVQQNTGFSRYNINTNMTYNPSRKFKMMGQLNNSIQQQRLGSGSGLINTGVASGGSASSLLPSPSLYSAVNEVLGTLETKNSNKTLNTFATLQLDYEIINNLKASTTLNYTNVTGTKDTFIPAAINGESSATPTVKSNGFGNYYAYNDRSTKLYNRTSLNYVYSIKDKQGEDAHNLNAFVFAEINSSNFKADVIDNPRVSNDNILGPYTAVPEYNQSLGGTLDNFTDFRSVAFAGQLSYNYKTRYVVDFNYRVDGSSVNGPLAGYRKNPSVAVKWNIDRENFAIKAKDNWLDYASIRASYGSNIAPNGNIYDVYGKYTGGKAYQYNNKPGVVLVNDRLPNLSLEPTKNTTLNGGIDLGLFKGKFTVSFDSYYKQVTQIFREKNIANINSFGSVTSIETANVNYGWEVQMTSRPLNPRSPFKLNIFGSIAINKEVLAALPDGVRLLIDADSETGQDIYRRLGINSLSNYLYHNKGVYATNGDVPVDPATGLRYRTGGNSVVNYFRAGDPIYTDLNGDYVLDANDRVVAGNSQPQITGGLGALLQYKNWSFEVNTSFTLIRDILNNALAAQFRNFNNPYALSNMVPLSQYNYWQGVGSAGAVYANPFDYTRSSIIDPYRYAQTLFQEDGTYFKLNSVKLYYNLNQSFSKKFGMNRVSVYLSALNLGFLTNYSGPNPEAVTALGRDSSGGYPISKQYALGLNVEF
ncbi:SusC/RagA family TonB-linked outer membrane protein [Pedobacter heparinus]|uniref:SusC/RagA family TonB-linked outer membrane protein n=1 Tax=Pedobacter heparinus TaxID=984 RepID=UPI00292E7F45|nr:SusC/RagA family TonB-linked outer membrane protein [Pedobacter heparinus]